MKKPALAVGAIVVIILTAGIVVADRPLLFLPEGTRIAMSGDWLDHSTEDSTQWKAEISKVEDDSFEGSICMHTEKDVRCGKMEGTASWGAVSGDLFTEGGEFMGEFDGSVDRSGAGGDYVLATGEEGKWAWAWQGAQ